MPAVLGKTAIAHSSFPFEIELVFFKIAAVILIVALFIFLAIAVRRYQPGGFVRGILEVDPNAKASVLTTMILVKDIL